MSNIALNKLPVEKEEWKSSEEATNGNSSNYTAYTGFASAHIPCSYTLEWENEVNVHQIRILLWDDMPSGKVNSRKYRFNLILVDEENVEEQVYSNSDEEGGNGWYIFNFKQGYSLKAIRLEGKSNSANSEFHIVEFEVHDNNPAVLNLQNIRYFEPITKLVIKKIVRELFLQEMQESNNDLSEIIRNSSNAKTAYDKILSFARGVETAERTIDFSGVSRKFKFNARIWLGFGVALSLAVLSYIVFSIYCDDRTFALFNDAKNADFPVELYSYLFIGHILSKAILLSFGIYLTTVLYSNFRAMRHNYVSNAHKAMALDTATKVLLLDNYKQANRTEVFKAGMDVVFSHQETGYSKSAKDDSRITTSLVENVFTKSPAA
jgi:hypothetical protein